MDINAGMKLPIRHVRGGLLACAITTVLFAAALVAVTVAVYHVRSP